MENKVQPTKQEGVDRLPARNKQNELERSNEFAEETSKFKSKTCSVKTTQFNAATPRAQLGRELSPRNCDSYVVAENTADRFGQLVEC